MGKKGFTFVEIIMALAVISIGIIGIVSLFSTALRAVNKDKVKLLSSFIAKDLIDEMLAKQWQESGGGSILGPETGETRSGTTANTIFDDIDDYNGLVEQPPLTITGNPMDGSTPPGETEPLPNYSFFRREALVEYVDKDTLVAPDPVPNNYVTEYKRVSVSVDYATNNDFNNPGYTLDLSQIVVDH